MQHYFDPTTWKSRADASIAHGALTNSKRTASFVEGAYPTHGERAHGVRFVADGREYLDFGCANGSNLLGYGHPEIGKAIARAYSDGSLLTIGSVVEVQAAEMLMAHIPFIRRLRFLKTGTEACLAAITMARAATGRLKVLSSGYHGWSPEFTSLSAPGHGCPPGYVRKLPDRLADIENWNELAAVIVEPVHLDFSQERKEWLIALSHRCREHGVVLIFDEVITGFRVPKLCIASHWGIYPDLICLGKAIGGGLPLAVVGGRADVMECVNEYFVSSTFAGETCALAAMMAVLKLLQNDLTSIDRLWALGQRWQEKFNELSGGIVSLEGYPTRGYFAPSLPRDIFMQDCALAGIVFSPSLFLAFPHEDEWSAFSTLEAVLWKIKTGRAPMIFQRPRSAFAQKVRDEEAKATNVIQWKSR